MALEVKVYDYTPQRPLVYTLKNLRDMDNIRSLWEAVCKVMVTSSSGESGLVRRKQRYKADWIHVRILTHYCDHGLSGTCSGDCPQCHPTVDNFHAELDCKTSFKFTLGCQPLKKRPAIDDPRPPLVRQDKGKEQEEFRGREGKIGPCTESDEERYERPRREVKESDDESYSERESEKEPDFYRDRKIVILVTRATAHQSNWMQFEDPAESNSFFMAEEWKERITPKMSSFISRREKRRLNAIEDFCEFARHGYVDSIEKSLKYGTISEFDVNTSNSSGETALFLSCVYGHEQILLKLLELEHLQISKPHDRTGSTPLHAIEKGRDRMVALLIANGADFHAKDLNLQTPLELARIKNSDRINKILEIFIQNGAKTWKPLQPFLPSSHWEVRHGYHWDKVGEEADLKLSDALFKRKSVFKFAIPVFVTFCDQNTRPKIDKVDFAKMEVFFTSSYLHKTQLRLNPEYRLPFS